ncbi:hypothetical protein KIPB_003362, partial [Kipferlia bialata]|eukprot:g3362.t1
MSGFPMTVEGLTSMFQVSLREPGRISPDMINQYMAHPDYALLCMRVGLSGLGDVSLQAAVQFKQAVKAHWRYGQPDGVGIPAANRALIRQGYRAVLGMQVGALFRQFTTALIHITRHDYPSQWPSLLNDVLSSSVTIGPDTAVTGPAVSSFQAVGGDSGVAFSDVKVLQQALLLCEAAGRGMSTVRVAQGRRDILQAAPTSFALLRRVFTGLLGQCMVAPDPEPIGWVLLACLKALKRIGLCGFRDEDPVWMTHLSDLTRLVITLLTDPRFAHGVYAKCVRTSLSTIRHFVTPCTNPGFLAQVCDMCCKVLLLDTDPMLEYIRLSDSSKGLSVTTSLCISNCHVLLSEVLDSPKAPVLDSAAVAGLAQGLIL